MDVLLGRPNIRRRRTYFVSVGESDDPADFLVALANVEAEIGGYTDGRCPQDTDGGKTPPIMDGVLSTDEQLELREALRVMRGFSAPRFGHATTVPFTSSVRKAWDLDALETVFRNAVRSVAPHARAVVSTALDEMGGYDERTEVIDPSARTLCLWSSLVHLAAECAVLKVKFRRRPRAIANA
ncbi:hypothetical protein KJ781_02855 [Patescibacteria group bacterium]|nr:hypothetical protein [Patescibacteria group bacterium]MBU1448648.1 hypothetical protein [Patescibacteria group bacterium]MBU2612906.1 hypothetical protein [Patescibacteria group bacterium]